MGSGSSKVDPYIIRIEDEKAQAELQCFRPTNVQKPFSSLEKTKSSSVLDRKKSNPHLLTNSGKIKSSSNIVPPVTAKARLQNATQKKNNVSSCSSTHPWLLKNAKLQGALNDYEFGRIIGTLA